MKKSAGRKFKQQISLFFETTQLEITHDPVIEPNYRRLPTKVKARINALHYLAQEKPQSTLSELHELIKKYPNVPILRNYLCVAYSLLGETEKAEETTLESIRLNPDYLFAKLNYAQLCLSRKEYDRIPEIFDHKFNLKLLCPKRAIVHISEFTSFMGIIGEYFFYIGKPEITKNIYVNLCQIEPHCRQAEELKRLLYPGLIVRLARFLLKLLPKRHS